MIKKLILTGVCGSIVGALAFFSAISVTFIPGVAALYPAAAFEAAFGSWFGIWGSVASYLGLLMAGTAGGWFSLPQGILLSVSDFLMALAPAIAVRKFNVDFSLPNINSAAKFVVITWLFGSVPGSLWYNYINMQFGSIADWSTFWFAVVGWNVGNLIILVAVGVPIMRVGTAIVKKADLYIQKMI